ncbi:MAG: DUF5053 domain-containing protein [Prevotella sp.]|jgi:hypothetical protein|nr:DUF5053 domain-containing protein [Prevotella sp.]
MKDRINKLKKDFCEAKSDKDRDIVDARMQELINENPDQFAEAMVESAKETANKATELALKQKMQDVIPAISLVYIAKTYFNKSDTWLYQRINGNVVNGKPASFTCQEIEKLKFALDDISKKIGSLSISL